eukprot:snap_masked-scaffold_3-processed-gene-2.14-mRNA-1 protein AED:1.00 eAED:1.00 QI:0/-1/0/0/-1/1/1/0/482
MSKRHVTVKEGKKQEKETDEESEKSEEHAKYLDIVRSIDDVYNFTISRRSKGLREMLAKTRSLRFVKRPKNAVLWSNEKKLKRRRLVQRDRPFYQSSPPLKMRQASNSKVWGEIVDLYRSDLFHVILNQPTVFLIMLAVIFYTAMAIFFAILYMLESNRGKGDCKLNSHAEPGDDIGFLSTLAFSIHTAATIGYGTLDDTTGFFKNCRTIPTIVYFQSVLTLVFNTLMTSILVYRIGRADRRSRTILFSNKATIHFRNGRILFSFRAYDLQNYSPLIEAHCRLYAVSSANDGRSAVYFQTTNMRIQHPDDALEAPLLLILPELITHEIDSKSPLSPNSKYEFPSLVSRDVDFRTGNQANNICAVCGEEFLGSKQLELHCRYDHGLNVEPCLNSGGEVKEKVKQKNYISSLSEEKIRDHMVTNMIEVIVVVEGIEPSSSASFQARHSYTIDDIVFHKRFGNCVSNIADRGGLAVNLNCFNQLI